MWSHRMILTIAERVNSCVAMFFHHFDEYRICELFRSRVAMFFQYFDEYWICELVQSSSTYVTDSTFTEHVGVNSGVL